MTKKEHGTPPIPDQKNQALAEKEDGKYLEEMCSAANRVIDHTYPVMEMAHAELSKMYSVIRERVLAGGEATQEDKNELVVAMVKWAEKIHEAESEAQEQGKIVDNFTVSSLLQMRTHRIHSIPFGSTQKNDESNFVTYIKRYLDTGDIESLPVIEKMQISDFYITPEDVKLSKIDIQDGLKDVAIINKVVAQEKNISIKLNFPDEKLFISAPHGLNLETFLEIFKNTISAMPDGGEITITGKKSDDQKHLVLTISDTGIGMSPDTLQKALAGGFTTKPTGTGRGLGLVRDYFEKILHGEFKVDSEEDKGTTLTITLPLAEK
ncbi:HAMP domain-containing histidine kinase [Patescibacteria group bacterium]|nr:HAMP domain-containing histidine kinase [Patescibacteria group bacterium]